MRTPLFFCQPQAISVYLLPFAPIQPMLIIYQQAVKAVMLLVGFAKDPILIAPNAQMEVIFIQQTLLAQCFVPMALFLCKILALVESVQYANTLVLHVQEL